MQENPGEMTTLFVKLYGLKQRIVALTSIIRPSSQKYWQSVLQKNVVIHAL